MSAREEKRNSQFPSRPSFRPVRVGVCLPSCSLRHEGRDCQEHSAHMYTHTHTPHGLFPETFTPVLGPGVHPPPTHSPAQTGSIQLPPPPGNLASAGPWALHDHLPIHPSQVHRDKSSTHPPVLHPQCPGRGLQGPSCTCGPVCPGHCLPQGRLTDGLQGAPLPGPQDRAEGRAGSPQGRDARSGAGFWAQWLCGLWVLTEKLSGLFSGGPAPSPRPSPSPSWKQGCSSPHTPDGRSPCPAPQDSLILIDRLFHVRHGLLFPLQRERQSRWAEGQPPGSAGSAGAAIPQPWTSCPGPTPLSGTDAIPAGPGYRLHAPRLTGGQRLRVSGPPRPLPLEWLGDREEPQGQPTPGAKLRAHGHREGPLHAVPSVKLSAPPRDRHRGRSRAMGPVEAGGTRGGHAAVEPRKAAVLEAPQTHR